jgi:hypothetical protein
MTRPTATALVTTPVPILPAVSIPSTTDDQHPFLVVARGGTTVLAGEVAGWRVIDLPRSPTEEDCHYLVTHGIPPWLEGRPATNREIVEALRVAIDHQRKVASGAAETMAA